jgi:hypothetical protein
MPESNKAGDMGYSSESNKSGDTGYYWKMPESFSESKKQSKTSAKKTSTGKPAGKMKWDPTNPTGPSFHETMPNAISTLEGKTFPAITPLASHKKPKQTKVAKPKDATFDLTGGS